MDRSLPRRGLSLVELLVVIAIVALLLGLTMASVQRVRASAARIRCADQLRQLALGLHSYHGVHSALPPGWTSAYSADRYFDLGWTARVLPHIEQQALWHQIEEAFRINPAGTMWQEPHVQLLGTPVNSFACPADSRMPTAHPPFSNGVPVAFTSYLGISDHRPFRYTGVLFPDSVIRLTGITDGTSNTLLLDERPPSTDFRFGWWYRGVGQTLDGSAEMLLSVREVSRGGGLYPDCSRDPYHFTPGRLDNQCDMFHFWSPHSGGANFAFAGGSVRFLRYAIDPLMPALATRAGGEAVTLPE